MEHQCNFHELCNCLISGPPVQYIHIKRILYQGSGNKTSCADKPNFSQSMEVAASFMAVCSTSVVAVATFLLITGFLKIFGVWQNNLAPEHVIHSSICVFYTAVT